MPFRHLEVLVVDDQAFIRNLVQGMLSRLGVGKIDAAPNGRIAQEILRKRAGSIRCVISDWNMTPVNGLELLQSIRTGSIPGVATSLPFILLTAYAESPVVTAAANMDVSAYLVKPTSSKRLAEALRLAISKPVAEKSPAFYRRVEPVEPPNLTRDPETSTAQWAKWVKSGRQAILAEHTTFIQRQAIELSEISESSAAQIRLIRYKRADRIKPGSILVEDFCDEHGSVLLSAGVVLNERMLKQLSNIKVDGEPPRLWVGRK